MAITDAKRLLAWEQAEIKRSSTEAAKVAAEIRPVSEATIRRYASASGDTPYPLEYAFHLVGDARGLDVLDFGCGTGTNSTLLAARGARVTSMDISPDLLVIAKQRVELAGFGESIGTLCASAHALPLPDASVDLVFGAAILHHLDLALTAAEVHRVLKPGGRAIFMEPIRNSRTLAALRRLIPYQAADVSPFERPLRHDEIHSFAASFTWQQARSFRLPFVPALRMALPKSAESWIFRTDRALLQRWPRLDYLATVMVFEIGKPR